MDPDVRSWNTQTQEEIRRELGAKPKATRTKKPSQPPPEPVAPPTDEEIAGRLLREAVIEREKLDKVKEQFLERFAVSPTDAMEWLGAPVAQQEAEAATWRIVERWLSRDDDTSLADRLAVISIEVQREQSHIVRFRTWESNDTSAFANVVRMYAPSGRARALEMISVLVGVAMAQVEARDKGEA